MSGEAGFYFRAVDHINPNRSRSKYTAKHGLWMMVWTEPHLTRAEAMDVEHQIKKMKSAKWISYSLLDQMGERVPMQHRD